MSQVVDLYGQSGADQLRNTCSYHIVFAQNEQKIAEDISRSIGNRMCKKMTFFIRGAKYYAQYERSRRGYPFSTVARGNELASV